MMDHTRIEPPQKNQQQTDTTHTDNPRCTPTTHENTQTNNNNTYEPNLLDPLCRTEIDPSDIDFISETPTSRSRETDNFSTFEEEQWARTIEHIQQSRLENQQRIMQLETLKKRIDEGKQKTHNITQHGNNISNNRTILQQTTNTSNEPEAQRTEKVIQWNLNGFYQRLDDIKLLIEELDPTVLCLQETRLAKKDKAKLAGYRLFRRSLDVRNRGVAIFVKSDTKSQWIDLQTDIQAIAVRVGFDQPITICSVYIAPNEPVTQVQIGNLADQLPRPYIITGDLNARNEIWDANVTTNNRMGTIFEEIVNDKGLVILNTGEMTHYSMAYNSLSAIDITVCTPDLANELGWHVVSDLHNSDHYPTVTTVETTKSSASLRRRWRYDTAKWSQYRTEISNNIQGRNPTIQQITEIIQEAANNNIKKTSGKPASRKIKWMTEELRE
jgi:exonuclease III